MTLLEAIQQYPVLAFCIAGVIVALLVDVILRGGR